MDGDDQTDVGPRAVLVLYADIAGSTRLFEEHGDAAARDSCAACIDVLTEVVTDKGGRVVKTIGDEILAVFDDPARGVMAGTDMQGALRSANEDGRFHTGELRIKVGMHFGLAVEEAEDVVGEAATVAQQVIKLAKADQVLASAETLETVPPMFRAGSRFLDRIATGSGDEFDVHELIWEVSGLTQVADTSVVEQRLGSTRLELRFGDQTLVCNEDRPLITIGRVPGNDLVVNTDLTSRQHAEISFRRGRFYLTDNSANGTLLVNEDGTTMGLRREQQALRGSGSLCVGGTPETNPAGLITFDCD